MGSACSQAACAASLATFDVAASGSSLYSSCRGSGLTTGVCGATSPPREGRGRGLGVKRDGLRGPPTGESTYDNPKRLACQPQSAHRSGRQSSRSAYDVCWPADSLPGARRSRKGLVTPALASAAATGMQTTTPVIAWNRFPGIPSAAAAQPYR